MPETTKLSVSDVAAPAFDLADFKGRPRIYVISTQPRCGSHYLADLLRQGKRAGVPLEYFHRGHWREWMKRCESKNPRHAFELLYRKRTTENGIFGVKAHWHQFSYAAKLGFEKYLSNAAFIYIVRDDLLGQAISHVIALQTGAWTNQQKSSGEAEFSFNAIAKSIKFILFERSRWERFYSFTGIAPKRLHYEHLLERRDEVMRDVCAFIGTEWHDGPTGSLAVQRTARNKEWRERFLELAAKQHTGDQFWKETFVEGGISRPARPK